MITNSKNFINKATIICLVLGAIFRLIWLDDMEWKGDEVLMYQYVIDFFKNGNFLTTGMKSGVGLPNFGASVWVFYLFGLFSLDPIGINFYVALINCFGLVLLYYIIIKYIPISEKRLWLISLIIFSVSFLPVSLSRKLWAQDTLPPFTILLLYFYIVRGTNLFKDFFLGFLIAFIGQIHMSGIFLGITYLAFILYFHFKNHTTVRLIPFFAGIFISSLLTLPYFYRAFIDSNFLHSGDTSSLSNFLSFRPLWYTTFQGFGLDIFYHFQDLSFEFFKFPYLYVTGFCFILCALIAIISIIFSLKGINTTLIKNFKYDFSSSITLQFCSISFISIFLISATGSRLVGHYFIASYPFIFLIAANFLLKFRNIKIVWLYIILQILITISFLSFIHVNQGFDKCEYGKTYQYHLNSKNQ